MTFDNLQHRGRTIHSAGSGFFIRVGIIFNCLIIIRPYTSLIFRFDLTTLYLESPSNYQCILVSSVSGQSSRIMAISPKKKVAGGGGDRGQNIQVFVR